MNPLTRHRKHKAKAKTPRKPRKRYQMVEPTVELTDRIIVSSIAPGSRVIDLGCGDGRLLVRLREEQDCRIQGVELDLDGLAAALGNGVPTLQIDLDRGLREIPNDAFDYAVLSQTLQEVRQPRELLAEMMRVSKRAIVVVPNFGHWRVRMEIMFRGRAPVTQSLPYEWFDTPNQRFFSLHDFRELLAHLECEILEELPIVGGTSRDRAWLANLRADNVMYILERRGDRAG